jgi:hypothetical protein
VGRLFFFVISEPTAFGGLSVIDRTVLDFTHVSPTPFSAPFRSHSAFGMPTPPANDVVRLVGVYNAKGSVLGELSYIFGKMVGSAHCGLCDITHSGVLQKTSWCAAVAALPVPLDAVHIDEQAPAVAALTAGKAACVVAERGDGGLEILISASELDACSGSVDAFVALVRRKLAQGGT